jgi:topoisomerase-4 subunit B
MPAAQLKETTMNPENRNLLQIKIPSNCVTNAPLTNLELEEKRHLDTTVDTLMGKKPELRFAYIQKNARFVSEIDI